MKARRRLVFDTTAGTGETPYPSEQGFYRLIARRADGSGEAAFPGQATAEEAWAMRESAYVKARVKEQGYDTFCVLSYRPILLIEDVTPDA